jgi:hypothetical protein
MATNSAESKVKHEVKKERGRTLLQPLNENKALKLTIRSCATTNFLLDAAPQTTPYFTHGTLRFCIPTMELRYQTPRLLLVTSSGYTQNRDYVLDKRRNIAYVYRMKNDIEPANKGETGFDADDLNLISLAQEYSDEDKARELLERLRWPNGAICPHCKNDGKTKPNSKLTPKAGSKSAVRKGVYFCGACRKQFTVTVKTVFEGSHWHHVSREHLPKYANEFAFRWSHSKMTDGARMAIGIPMVEGKRLMYRKPAN